jgi:hypothetical protein
MGRLEAFGDKQGFTLCNATTARWLDGWKLPPNAVFALHNAPCGVPAPDGILGPGTPRELRGFGK